MYLPKEPTMSPTPAESGRTPPRERFAISEDAVDLAKAAEALRKEPGEGQHGRRQMALFRHGPETVALYSFEPGAKLPGHVIEGPVLIQVLNGRLKVRTQSTEHELATGMLLRLAPNVEHDVEAIDAADMLLTVCIEGPNSHHT
jgi:quercetin dioxygenase-like cupin family protein